MKDILLIEDNEELGKLLFDFLVHEGFSVLLCNNAEAGIEKLNNDMFRLILLDVILPGMNGFETCNYIRLKENIPILLMSAKADDESKILGYDNGADDYIEKPFSIPVIIAKIKSMLNRKKEVKNHIVSSCGIVLNCLTRKVYQNDKEIIITGKSFDVLLYLMQHTGEIVKKEEIFNSIWGADCFSEPSTLNVHIRWLREKLEKDPKNPIIIKTVWKVGYVFGESFNEV